MSFFHVLPSNVAPNTFPENHASSFSTPVENAYHLNGKWEIALMNITYSGCVNTFHNDEMKIEKEFNIKDRLATSSAPIKFDVNATTIPNIFKELNEKLEGVIKFTLLEKFELKHFRYEFEIENVILVLSVPLQNKMSLWNDVLTPWDNHKSNYGPLDYGDKRTPIGCYVMLVPLSHPKRTIRLKEKNEVISTDTFVERFKANFKNKMDIKQFHNKERFTIWKNYNVKDIVVFTKALHYMTNFRTAGMFAKNYLRYIAHNFHNNFKESWEMYIIPIGDIADVESEAPKMTVPVHLGSQSFFRRNTAVTYLNNEVKRHNVMFTLLKNNTLQLEIKDKNVSVTFSDTLRDIFAFDQSTYSGKGIWKASDIFSLTRRIRYCYIYSNVSDFIRIGDTEAPLLAVIPFNTEACITRLQEKTFQEPMYVPVIQNPIHQIDIQIYDGAGQLIPFTQSAVTSLRLHFRQV